MNKPTLPVGSGDVILGWTVLRFLSSGLSGTTYLVRDESDPPRYGVLALLFKSVKIGRRARSISDRRSGSGSHTDRS